jgi:hypothetical protein
MLTTPFDQLATTLAATRTRRGLLHLLTLTAGLGTLNLTATAARKDKIKKKCFNPCSLCTTCLQGKCQPKPHGTSCGRGLVCHGGTCACDATSCNGNEVCVDGACIVTPAA